ncbi:ABC transporter permease [Verrucomicrobiaceae bacterium 5K15]|uniref:ABC transporter permease n=1 Tax=Oceaniferula flava TaxID=2800421 RepID=A0AAE2SBP7_9BACT|nr:FtsX-like permease family protein [Oceaniferula flavus]MBK1853989.1 ABC transporter permease [Oceaniferula flavus]MBM1135295.1 ABC transporter permease [Oceaniferula flavus]
MLNLLKHLFSGWAWKMAWRDSRPVRWKLLLFSASIVFGVAALVTIGSLRENLTDSVSSQAKSLLGADLMLSSREPFSEETQSVIDEITDDGGVEAKEISFTTMLAVGEDAAPKLVTVRGLEPIFPFYGQVKTEPEDAWQKVQQSPGLIVEASFLKRMNGRVGDLAKLGEKELPIIGVLRQSPPSGSGFAAMSPTVVTSIDVIKDSGLLGARSMVFYRSYFKLPKTVDTQALAKANREVLGEQRVRQVTSQKRSENVEEAINRLYLFFNLIGFSALFLGGIGVAGAIHIHISERLQSVATLRCLGCSAARAFAVYLAQCIAMGVVGTVAGIVLGSGFVYLLRWVVASLPAGLLPFAVEVAPVGWVIAKAAGVGLLICICFALLPLLAVRQVSPLAALRREEAAMKQSGRDPFRWLVIVALVALAFGLTWMDSHDAANGWKTALGYIAFLGLAFLFLLLAGKLLRWLTSLIARPSWPFVVRQGIASLYRPNNQTGLFMVSIGLGTFLIFTLMLMQSILLQWLDPVRLESKPNLFLVDVPPEQNAEVGKLITDTGVKMLGNAPIVQMRLTEIKGQPVSELVGPDVKDGKRIPRWIVRREFRSTYRSELTETEKLSAGEWVADYQPSADGGVIPVSFEDGIAADLGLGIGDEVTVSLEGFGETKKLRVASLREVDWRSMDLNFFIVFPPGSIDDYVSFNVMAAHSPSDESTAQLQQAMFKRLPFVNTIDLSLILKTVQSVLSAASKTVQIMALFTVVTGGIVLVASILAGRRIRIRESVLLRTLGASRKQISQILAVEYTLLAAMATLAGSSLALVASVLLGNLVFDGESYQVPWGLLFTSIAVVISITVALGMLLSRGIASRPPLQILRSQ